MPAAVLRAGMDSLDGVDHLSAVCLSGASSSARFGPASDGSAAVSCYVSLTSGVGLSVRTKEKNSKVLIFSDFE